MAGKLLIIRAYDIDDTCQGRRILVDKLWPRGIKKESLEPFEWAKEITPSTQIRKFFDHKAENFENFPNFIWKSWRETLRRINLKFM